MPEVELDGLGEDLGAAHVRVRLDWLRETARAEGVAPNIRWHLCRDGSRVFIEGTVRALRDPDGALFLAGRMKELIIRSGFNVYPAEVERALTDDADDGA